MKEILDVVHKTIYQFLDVCGDNEEVPMSDKNKLLLEVNKAICDNLKALEQEPFMNKACVSNKVCEHDKKVVLDKISARIELEKLGYPPSAGYYKAIKKCLQIINKYKEESEKT